MINKVEDDTLLTRAYKIKRTEPSKTEETCPGEIERIAAQNAKWTQEYKEGKRLKKGFWDTHNFEFTKRKEPWYLIYQILDCCKKGRKQKERVSVIQYVCEMSWCQMKYYMQLLEWNGMLKREEFYLLNKDGHVGTTGNRKRVFYHITDKGKIYLLKYKALNQQCFNVRDGLRLFRDPDD